MICKCDYSAKKGFDPNLLQQRKKSRFSICKIKVVTVLCMARDGRPDFVRCSIGNLETTLAPQVTAYILFNFDTLKRDFHFDIAN